MYTSWIILAVLTTLVYLIGYACYRTQHKRLKERQVTGLESTCNLLTMMKAVQQHRGVSSGILGGKKDQEGKLANLRNSIDTQIKLLDAPMKAAYKEQWNTIIPKWQHIQQHWKNEEVLNNFENHCDILEEIQALICDVTDFSALTSSSEYEEQVLAGEIFAHFPAIIEDLGQLRALSTHAAARKDCITAFRLHLQFLMEQLSQHNYYLSKKDRKQYEALISEVNNLINLVNQEILETEKITIDPDRLFQRATQVMDSCFSTIDKGIDRFKHTGLSAY